MQAMYSLAGYPYPQSTGVTVNGLAPQGLIGGILGSVGGGLIGDVFGHRDLGSAIGGVAGGLLPFHAGPQMIQPQLVPMGAWGNFLSGLAPVVGGAVGGDVGRAISGIGQTVGGLLPFHAGPQMIQPQHFLPQAVLPLGTSGLGPVMSNCFPRPLASVVQ